MNYLFRLSLLILFVAIPVFAQSENQTVILNPEAAIVEENHENIPKIQDTPATEKSFSRHSQMPDYIKMDMLKYQQSASPHQTISAAKTDTNEKLIPSNPNDAYKVVEFGISEKRFNPNMEYEAIYKFIREKYSKVSPDDAKQISGYLVDYGRKHDVDPKFVAALMARESSFNRNAVSKTGAKGLGQIKEFNFKSLNILDPFDIKQNVSGTTEYLKTLKKRWGENQDVARLTLASYFKGPNAVSRSNGVVDAQTHAYVNDILAYYEDIKSYRSSAR